MQHDHHCPHCGGLQRPELYDPRTTTPYLTTPPYSPYPEYRLCTCAGSYR